MNEKLSFSTVDHKRIYKFIIDSIPNDWKHLLRTETSQKSLLKTFNYNNKGTREKKRLLKIFKKTFWCKTEVKLLLNGLRNALMDISFLIHIIDNAPIILCPRCKELFNFNCNFVSCFNQLKETATELGSKETLLMTWNSLLSNNVNLNIPFNKFSQSKS